MQQSATIIPFPNLGLENQGVESHVQANEAIDGLGPSRLSSALEALQAALEEQQRTLREWRFAIAELSIGVAGLGHSLVVYQDNLGEVAGRLETLRDRSADLGAWADTQLRG